MADFLRSSVIDSEKLTHSTSDATAEPLRKPVTVAVEMSQGFNMRPRPTSPEDSYNFTPAVNS